MQKNETGYSVIDIAPDATSAKGERSPHDALQLAMVYSPINRFRALYSPEKALSRGTLFEELDKPLGKGACYDE